MFDIVMSPVIRERLNTGSGQVINASGGIANCKARIVGPESAGGLTDTMEDRPQIATALSLLLDNLVAGSLEDQIATIYVDFVRGDPTKFHYAQVFGFVAQMWEMRGSTAPQKLMVLGQVVKNPFGGGYRWKPPSKQVLTIITDKRQVIADQTATQTAGLRDNGLADLQSARDQLRSSV